MLVSNMAVIRKVLQESGESVWQFVEPNPSHDEGLSINEHFNELAVSANELCPPSSVSEASVTKKKKKKSKNKKGRSDSLSEKGRRIYWGFVEEILFTRDLSFDAVPRQGIYPLGLGKEVDRQTLSIDDYIRCRRLELKSRAIDLRIPYDFSTCNSANGFVENESTNINTTYSPMETRQFDYRAHGTHNPLFHHVIEDERLQLLSPLLSTYPKDGAQDISRLHHDLKLVQHARDKSNLGCSCKHVKVDKLSLGKMRSELQSQAHIVGINADDVMGLSKTEITAKMKELLKSCDLCVENKCECVQLGLPCSSELCGCLRHGYRPGQQQVCANAFGRSLFDPDAVHTYRTALIAPINIEFAASAAVAAAAAAAAASVVVKEPTVPPAGVSAKSVKSNKGKKIHQCPL